MNIFSGRGGPPRLGVAEDQVIRGNKPAALSAVRHPAYSNR